jgi:hypothetical protein
MSQKKSPLQILKASHGSKAQLVEALAGALEPAAGESAEELKARLLRVSNAKLLHLQGVAERVKALGGRAGLVKAIAELKGQPKDHEYADALGRRSLAELVDLHGSLSRRAAGKAGKATPRRARRRRSRYS